MALDAHRRRWYGDCLKLVTIVKELCMEQLGHLLTALATLAWPMVALVVISAFKGPLAILINSAKDRKFTFKVAGQEITMEEANQQQQRLIDDLQTQVLELRRRRDEGPAEAKPSSPAVRMLEEPIKKRRVLWVDDNPKNNSFILQRLEERGFSVDLALSTDEGINLFAANSYLLVVSDMGRKEGGKYNPSAGLSLLRELRKDHATVPVLFFTSSESSRKYQEEVLAHGPSGITSSPTELWELIADNLVAIAAA